MTTSTSRLAVCGAIILASCSGPSPSPTAPSPSPAAALGPPPLAVLVDGQRGGTAIAGVSEVTIEADATAPANTKVRYQVDFGDGQSSQQAAPKHVYADSGLFHVTVTATDAAGRTSSAAQDVSVGVVKGARRHWTFRRSGTRDATRRGRSAT